MKRQLGIEPVASKPQTQGPPQHPKKAPPRSDSKPTVPPSPGNAPAAEAAPPTPAAPAAASTSVPTAVPAATPAASPSASVQLAHVSNHESGKLPTLAATVPKQAVADPTASAEPSTAASQPATNVKAEEASRSASPALGHHKQKVLAAAMPASSTQAQPSALAKATGGPKAISQGHQVTSEFFVQRDTEFFVQNGTHNARIELGNAQKNCLLPFKV